MCLHNWHAARFTACLDAPQTQKGLQICIPSSPFLGGCYLLKKKRKKKKGRKRGIHIVYPLFSRCTNQPAGQNELLTKCSLYLSRRLQAAAGQSRRSLPRDPGGGCRAPRPHRLRPPAAPPEPPPVLPPAEPRAAAPAAAGKQGARQGAWKTPCGPAGCWLGCQRPFAPPRRHLPGTVRGRDGGCISHLGPPGRSPPRCERSPTAGPPSEKPPGPGPGTHPPPPDRALRQPHAARGARGSRGAVPGGPAPAGSSAQRRQEGGMEPGREGWGEG